MSVPPHQERQRLPIIRAIFDGYGRPNGFYPEPFWNAENVPPGAVEIPYLAYLEFLHFAGQRRWNGTDIVPLTFTPASESSQTPELPPEIPAVAKRLSDESQQLHRAIAAAIVAWAGLENALAYLLDCFVSSQAGNGLGLLVYYTPSATETRMAIVQNTIGFVCSAGAASHGQDRDVYDRLQKISDALFSRISSAKKSRNAIVHGNIATISVGDRQVVRLTKPIFDMTPQNRDHRRMIENLEKQISGDTRLQNPGMGANEVNNAATNYSELTRLCGLLRWPFIVIQINDAEPPSLHDTLRELESCLAIVHNPPKGAQIDPERQAPLPPSPE